MKIERGNGDSDNEDRGFFPHGSRIAKTADVASFLAGLGLLWSPYI